MQFTRISNLHCLTNSTSKSSTSESDKSCPMFLQSLSHTKHYVWSCPIIIFRSILTLLMPFPVFRLFILYTKFHLHTISTHKEVMIWVLLKHNVISHITLFNQIHNLRVYQTPCHYHSTKQKLFYFLTKTRRTSHSLASSIQ